MSVVYVNFAKALDKVPHQRLIDKLRALGIDGNICLGIEGSVWGLTENHQNGLVLQTEYLKAR